MAVALWSIWLTRNGLVFNGKVVKINDILFNTKMRTLLWLRVLQEKVLLRDDVWWDDPISCCMCTNDLASETLWQLPICGSMKLNVDGTASAWNSVQLFRHTKVDWLRRLYTLSVYTRKILSLC
ncbi:hypothetical protein V6N12_068400 [Hibiscus sabdariffa]|uniref:Reverse transcriptase zinc-binding domain-containing protein n=1 Tax=Hibiscus sabdariffa TaxID=183260 RepID=A0ABR2FQL1_9ROSI